MQDLIVILHVFEVLLPLDHVVSQVSLGDCHASRRRQTHRKLTHEAVSVGPKVVGAVFDAEISRVANELGYDLSLQQRERKLSQSSGLSRRFFTHLSEVFCSLLRHLVGQSTAAVRHGWPPNSTRTKQSV